MTTSLSLPMPAGLDALGALLDQVAERQRQDFGQLDSEAKADGSLITACDRWSDATLVEGLAQLYPGEGVLSEEGSQCVPRSDSFWVVDPLDGTTNFAAGIPYWAISLARFEQGVPVLGVLDVPPLRQRIIAIRGGGAWRKHIRLEPPSARNQVAGCASLCSRSIGVLQKLPDQRFPGKIRLLGVASLNLVSVAMGQTISALEATPKIWDLAAAWLVLQELNCPMAWLARDPAQLTPGEDLSQANFPVLAARDAATLALFKPWADALVSPG